MDSGCDIMLVADGGCSEMTVADIKKQLEENHKIDWTGVKADYVISFAAGAAEAAP